MRGKAAVHPGPPHPGSSPPRVEELRPTMLELRGRERKGFQIEIEFLPRIYSYIYRTGVAVP